VKAKFSDPRRTQLIEEEGELSIEDLITDEDVAVTVTDTGYIKRTPITTYRTQNRGGKGRIGMRTREEDVVNHLFVASTHSYMMIFSDRGRAYWLKVHEIPDVGADGKGKSIANLVQMESGEKLAAMIAVQAVRRVPLHRHGHAQGHDQEDRAVGVRQPARRRHHCHGHRRGR
jgi:DNA gyrase subunit A